MDPDLDPRCQIYTDPMDSDPDSEHWLSWSQKGIFCNNLTVFCTGEGSSFLTFLKGDLIILEDSNTGETVQNSGTIDSLITKVSFLKTKLIYILQETMHYLHLHFQIQLTQDNMSQHQSKLLFYNSLPRWVAQKSVITVELPLFCKLKEGF